MKRTKKIEIGALIGIIIIGYTIGLSVILNNNTNSNSVKVVGFPDFYTKTEDYFITRIGDIPDIDELSY